GGGAGGGRSARRGRARSEPPPPRAARGAGGGGGRGRRSSPPGAPAPPGAALAKGGGGRAGGGVFARRDPRDLDRRDPDRRDFDRRDLDRRDGDRRGFDDRGDLPGGYRRDAPDYVPGGYRRGDVDVRSYEEVRRARREYNDGGRLTIREPGRVIVRDNDRYFIHHDETERFRELDRDARIERRGRDTVTIIDRPGGYQVFTVVDDDGRLLRRYRRGPDGREVVLIDNSYGGPPRSFAQDVVVLPPPDIRIPRERYVVEAERADEGAIYEALTAPPVAPVERRYTLDEVRYSPSLRARMRSVDIDTITFDTGSWEVSPEQARRLSTIAAAVNQAIQRNPQEVFLIEGHTDAVGNDVDNLSLSDRRAQSVAAVLTRDYRVPPENLTTQGYGEQYLKVNTQGASRENRRVTVRRITPLIQQQAQQR
ncbi:OmpA family protein, partial [Methylobacterium variabile]|uniref:OmpA family protein n=1 Tax=Methylobacterium variabile TaxID=298794 RepID=UPI0006541E4D